MVNVNTLLSPLSVLYVFNHARHYENLPVHYRELFQKPKLILKTIDISSILTYIDCGHTLEPPSQGVSNKNPTIYVLEQK